MGISSDVKATTLTADGAVFAGPARVKALSIIPGAVAGSVVIKDGGASGSAVLTIATPADATKPMYLDLPGNGVRCETSAYCDVTNITSVTVIYA